MSTDQTYFNRSTTTVDGEARVHVNGTKTITDDDDVTVQVLTIEVVNYENNLVMELVVNADKVSLTVGGEDD
jgi:hypothetical protein